MRLVEHISKEELEGICTLIGEAFVTNELFHEFGTIEERHDLVMKYMNAYVKCTYESKALYCSDDKKAYIGLAYSNEEKKLPQFKMLFRLLRVIPFKTAKKFMSHVNQIAKGNAKYTKNDYLEILMVCVSKDCQGKGRTRQLVDFAKDMARKHNVPILFDTDMEDYAKIYQHYGCTLYNQITASNGVTRYDLVWKPEE